MGRYLGICLIVVTGTAVLLIGAMRRRAEWVLNIVLRAVLGMIAVYFINLFLESRGISPVVGINGITFLTSAILGFPGLAALYGLGFYRFL